MGKASGPYGFFGVARGRSIGVFNSWYVRFRLLIAREVCRELVDGFPAAVFKGFHTFEEATNFVAEHTLNGFERTAQQSREVAKRVSGRIRVVAMSGYRNMNVNKGSESPSEKPIIDISPRAAKVSVAGVEKSNRCIALEANPFPYCTPQTVRSTCSPNSPLTSSKQPFSNCSAEQREILSLVSNGRNVFFTGSAGTGKTFVVHQIRHLLRTRGLIEHIDFFVTASTGIFRFMNPLI